MPCAASGASSLTAVRVALTAAVRVSIAAAVGDAIAAAFRVAIAPAGSCYPSGATVISFAGSTTAAAHYPSVCTSPFAPPLPPSYLAACTLQQLVRKPYRNLGNQVWDS